MHKRPLLTAALTAAAALFPERRPSAAAGPPEVEPEAAPAQAGPGPAQSRRHARFRSWPASRCRRRERCLPAHTAGWARWSGRAPGGAPRWSSLRATRHGPGPRQRHRDRAVARAAGQAPSPL